MKKSRQNTLQLLFTVVNIVLFVVPIAAQTTAFTYQGKLTDSGTPATGTYDFQVKLSDTQALGTGTQQGTTLTITNITVTGGVFTLQLDFGACPSCFNGANRFLEIAVKLTSNPTFTTLSPRQPLTSTPYAIRSLNSTAADGLSVACVNCITSSQIQSVSGSAVTGTIPIASVPAGSPNYIQNQNAAPQAADFNISGNGTAGGTLSAIVLNATKQYNLGGSRVLSALGTRNLFAGFAAGQANTTGTDNAFFGFNAGLNNLNGIRNTYGGVAAGQANVNGHDSTFFGYNAGFSNTGFVNPNAVANYNSFFGSNAGRLDTTGGFNSFFGANAGSDSTTGNTNSFFGYNAGSRNAGNDNAIFGSSAGFLNKGSRNSIYGVSAGRQSFFGDPDPTVTGDDNAFFGASAGSHNLTSGNSFFGAGAGGSNTSGGANAFFGYAAGVANTVGAINAFFGYNTGVSNTLGSNNAFFGSYAGFSNTTGQQNAFFGSNAGAANTSAYNNAFFGYIAGEANTEGSDNAFFGSVAGNSNTTGSLNAFFGYQAGSSNTVGSGNAFFGYRAGSSNTEGSGNAFFGKDAGLSSIGYLNIFIGRNAGRAYISGSSNVFIGADTGGLNTAGNSNTLVGDIANLGASNLDHATAIGAGAIVTASNRVQIGRTPDQFQSGDTVAIGAFAMPSTSTHVCINNLGVFTACSSSRRYKDNVQSFTPGVNLIQRLRPVTFNWKEGHAPDLGLLAEEVAEVEPLLTIYNTKGEIEGVKYAQLNVVLINAVKEQQVEIEKQNDTIKEQQARVEQYRKQLAAQQARITEQAVKLAQQQGEIDALKQLLCRSHPRAEVCRATRRKQ